MKTVQETRVIHNLCMNYEGILSTVVDNSIVEVRYLPAEELIEVTIKDWGSGMVEYHKMVNVRLSSVKASVKDFLKQCLIPLLEDL